MRASHLLLLSTGALLALGLVMVHSASAAPGAPVWWIEGPHALHAALALTAMGATALVPVTRWERSGWWALAVGAGFVVSLALAAATLVPGVGDRVHGATRWLSLGPLTFQPSELVKWSSVGLIALWAARSGTRLRRAARVAPAMASLALACGLIVVEDLGTAVLLGAVGVGTLLAGGARWGHVLAAAPAAGAALLWTLVREPYRLERLRAFAEPWNDPRGIGYHPIQSMVAVAEGGITGHGLGAGVQKLGFLPADSSDFLFAVICEELGLAGALLVIALFLAVLWSGVTIARRAPSPFARVFALGAVSMVTAQAVMNMAVVTVLLPPKGIPLPLVSSGGTGWVATAASLGLVAAADSGPPDFEGAPSSEAPTG